MARRRAMCRGERSVAEGATFHRTPNDKRSDSEWLRRRQRLHGPIPTHSDDIIISAMSPKRSSSPPGTNSGPNNKRARPRPQRQRPVDQPSIDSFFKSSRVATNVPADSPNSNSLEPPRKPTPRATQTSILDGASPVIIDVDLVSDPDPDVQGIPTSSSCPASQSASATATTTATGDPSPQYPNLSVDPASFALNTCFWPSHTRAPYSFLVHALCALSATRSRIAILNILTNALQALARFNPPSLLPSLYLLSNSLAPPYVPVELGLGPSIISKAIQHVSGITPAALKRLYNQTGDSGDVAFLAKCSVRTLVPHAPLSIQGVYDTLLSIAHVKGKGAVTQKQAMVEKLLVAAKGEEIRYLVRTLSQHIRVGAVRTTVLAALARALVLTPSVTTTSSTPSGSSYTASPKLVAQVSRAFESSSRRGEDSAKTLLLEKFSVAEALLKKVFVRHPNYDHIVSAILQVGLDGLEQKVLLSVGTCV
jgi:DNA ligase 1